VRQTMSVQERLNYRFSVRLKSYLNGCRETTIKTINSTFVASTTSPFPKQKPRHENRLNYRNLNCHRSWRRMAPRSASRFKAAGQSS